LLRTLSRNHRFLPFLLSFALLCGCTSPVPFYGTSDSSSAEFSVSGTDSAAFDEFTRALFVSEITDNTINLHFTLSNPSSYDINDCPVTLGSLSAETTEKAFASLENTRSALSNFRYDSLTTNQKLTWDILMDYVETELSACDYVLYDEPLRPTTGIQSQLPILFEEYRFYDRADVEDYLELIALTKDYFQQIIEFEKEKAAAGLFMSDFACDAIITQCETFTAKEEDHYLTVTFNHKVDALSDLTLQEKEAFKSQNASLVTECVLPAYDYLANELTLLLGSGKNDAGLTHFEQGKEYYEYLLYYDTGCSLPIPQIRQMINDKRSLDLSTAALLTASDAALWETCKNVSLPSTDAVTTLSSLKELMLANFPAAPEVQFTVSSIDECVEDFMAPAFYITSPIDNYESNSIFINASTDTSSLTFFTTLAHEGFPGHLYQTVMSYEAGIDPVRSILNYPGYVEGWATYVEMISYQYADLEPDVAELLFRNQSALLSLYASTDIGIHYDGWSYEDTTAFWKEYGIVDEQAIREIYELIVEEPTHYLKYYVGYLNFLELKESAKETYGEAFDEITFHQAILAIGPAPFALIEKYLPAYYGQD
jgi:uncharacterized protein (DUF885 family)